MPLYARSRLLRNNVDMEPNAAAPIVPATDETSTVITVELSVATLAAG